jgi:transglutaminase-like putative cysteine protease
LALAVTAFTLLVTFAVFYFAPRRDAPASGGLGARISVIGYSGDVNLGELDAVAEDPQVVMNVQFIDPVSKTSFQAASPPLMRGSVVTTYSPQSRSWSQGDWDSRTIGGLHTQRLQDTSLTDAVEQRITLEPLREQVVFSVFPPVSIDRQMAYNAERLQLVRATQRRATFHVGTLGFDGQRQARIIPQTEVKEAANAIIEPGLAVRLAPKTQEYLDECLTLPLRSDGQSPFPGLAALARSVVEDANVPRVPDAAEGEPGYDPYLAARALENYLRYDGGFVYALEPRTIPRGVDPIEDFVINQRSGHCEYFASALVMMLRSLDIPARMVIGFRVEEWNSLGKFYVVRQLHAHAWVEAFLKPGEIRRHGFTMAQMPFSTVVADPDSITRGGWLLLDPTAAATIQANRYAAGWFGRFRELGDYMQNGWTHWVLGMDANRQDELIFQPIARALEAPIAAVRGDRSFSERIRGWFAAATDALSRWIGGDWFSWRGGLAAVVLCLILLAVASAVRAAWRWLRRVARADRLLPTGPLGGRIAFNERFQRLLARHGWTRQPGQTSLEFAEWVGRRLAHSPLDRDAATAPRRIVDAFYQVRYGRRALDNRQAAAVEKALADLESALARQPRGAAG